MSKLTVLKEKLNHVALVAAVAATPAITFAAEGDGAVSVDASAITSLMTPIATVGGAVLTVLIGIRGWKLMRRAL